MNNRPIHQNLDTSYVNLSSLVKYLKKRQFNGRVKVRLNGYNAEILIKDGNRLTVREQDLISGRVSEGAEAFQRLLIRSREPGGTIDVFQRSDSDPTIKKAIPSKPKPIQTAVNVELSVPAQVVEILAPNPPKVPSRNGKNGHSGNLFYEVELNGQPEDFKTKPDKNQVKPNNIQAVIPDFPFELSNRFEKKASQCRLSVEDWQLLLKLTVEILGVVDRSLSTNNLDFAAAFRKARTEIAGDYPFMNPASGIFDYEDRRITMTTQVNDAVFVRSIIESLKRIFDRLAQNPKFSILYRDTAHLIIALINKRGSHYDRFGITPPLRRIIGI